MSQQTLAQRVDRLLEKHGVLNHLPIPSDERVRVMRFVKDMSEMVAKEHPELLRRHALLQAAAAIYGGVEDATVQGSVTSAYQLLAEIERRESGAEIVPTKRG